MTDQSTSSDPTSLPDEALVTLVSRRDEAALGILYDRYIRLVFSVALRITGDRQTAEEVVQDVFQNVWLSAHTYQLSAGAVSSWLLGITRHRAIDATRSKRERARNREQALDITFMSPASGGPEDELDKRLQRDAVRDALAELPSNQRQAIELAYYGGFTGAEIAERLGEPVGTIKTRLRLGLLKLRDRLQALHE
ncbi:MAG TPA: sigma-70 family RNA polymerase sigma factor [Roseiflexaceae bacterium]|nr:sigma-70 family RNA polymerase sigma factor [Roseiflexaceae bacterium]